MSDDFGPFHVGDSDLVFLGVAAVLAARWHMRRKGGSVPVAGFPQSDDHAFQLLLLGIRKGVSIPLDDVPDVGIAVYSSRDVFRRLKAWAGETEHDDEDGEWDDEDE